MDYDKSLEVFLDTIKRNIDEKGWKQKFLASQTGLNENTISRILKGQTEMSIGTFIRIGNSLGMERLLNDLSRNFKQFKFKLMTSKEGVVIGMLLRYDKPFAYIEYEIKGDTILTLEEGNDRRLSGNDILEIKDEMLFQDLDFDESSLNRQIILKPNNELFKAYLMAYELMHRK